MNVPVEPDWDSHFNLWLEPFLAALANKKRRQWAPVYLAGLMGGANRKCVSPLAREMAPGEREQLHHFVSASPWLVEPLLDVLAVKANELVGGKGAHLIIDDTALVKKGRFSPGVAHQYCGELGKKANCQSLVSLTLANYEVPVALGLRLFLPKGWEDDTQRRQRCGIPDALMHREKWRIALEEVDRVLQAGVEFGDVLADAGYGHCAKFRHSLDRRGLNWTVGVQSDLNVYPKNVRLISIKNSHGRPRKHPDPSVAALRASEFIGQQGAKIFRTVTWRKGTKGKLSGRFACLRIRAADGAKLSRSRRRPGKEVWLICERRAGGEQRYYLSNLPADSKVVDLVRSVKARWACEQPHQQMKQELGLDHFEGRTYLGLCHHALLSMIAFCYLQHQRLGGKKN